MDIKTYTTEALKTESTVESIDVNPILVHSSLLINSLSAEMLNQIKRAAFYKKDFDQNKFNTAILALANGINYIIAVLNQVATSEDTFDTKRFLEDKQAWIAPLVNQENPAPQFIIDKLTGLSFDKIDKRVLHSIIGIASEAGELSMSALKTIDGADFDNVNFGEELGDVEWYQAVAFDAAGLSEADIRTANIAKLAKRREKANVDPETRDLEAERAILEQNLAGDDTAAVVDAKAE